MLCPVVRKEQSKMTTSDIQGKDNKITALYCRLSVDDADKQSDEESNSIKNQKQILQDYCKKIGIDFLSTPDEEESLEFLVSLSLPFIKVGSGEVTNIPYLRKIGACKMPVILSTGMSNIGQVAIAYDTLLQAGAKEVSLLHGFQMPCGLFGSYYGHRSSCCSSCFRSRDY